MIRARKVKWQPQEIDAVASRIRFLRTQRPGESLVKLSNDAQEVLDPIRRRSIGNKGEIHAILDRIAEIDRKEFEEPAHTRQQFLESVTDQEIVEHFGPRFLRIVTAILSPPKPEPPKAQPIVVTREQRNRLPKIAFVGLLPAQQHKVHKALEGIVDCRMVSKDVKPKCGFIPNSVQHVIVWTRYVRGPAIEVAERYFTRDQIHKLSHRGLDSIIDAARNIAKKAAPTHEHGSCPKKHGNPV